MTHKNRAYFELLHFCLSTLKRELHHKVSCATSINMHFLGLQDLPGQKLCSLKAPIASVELCVVSYGGFLCLKKRSNRFSGVGSHIGRG